MSKDSTEVADLDARGMLLSEWLDDQDLRDRIEAAEAREVERAKSPRETAEGWPAGFSLLELLVVVAIIGLVASIAMPNLSWQLERARLGAATNDMRVAQKAIDSFIIDNDRPPTQNELPGLLRERLPGLTIVPVFDFLPVGSAQARGFLPADETGSLGLPVTPTVYVATLPVDAHGVGVGGIDVERLVFTGGGSRVFQMPGAGAGPNPVLVGDNGPSGGIPDLCPTCPGGGR